MSWTADDWQKRCMVLASRFHGVGILQEIPDSNDGDCGLEGFSTDETAVGYQCYVPENDAQTPLTDRLIAKINSSTLQMKDRQTVLAKLLKNIKLKRWYLMIPREYFRDKKVVEHAGDKRTEVVKQWNLGFISDEFRIVIGYGAEFDAIEKALAERFGKERIQLDAACANAGAADDWEQQQNAASMQGLDGKLAKTGRPPAALKQIRDELIRCAVITQNQIDKIRLEDPEGWASILQTKSERANALRQESALTSLVPADFLQKVMKEYTESIQLIMPSLSPEAARILSNDAIIEWLIACPLDFYTT